MPRRHLSLPRLVQIGLLVGLAASCDDPAEGPGGPRGEVVLQIAGLPEIAPDHYEGWLWIDGSPWSFGTFDVREGRGPVDPTGALIETFDVPLGLHRVDRVLITRELAGDRDAAPSRVQVLAGALVGGEAALSTDEAVFDLDAWAQRLPADTGAALASGSPPFLLPPLAGPWRYQLWYEGGAPGPRLLPTHSQPNPDRDAVPHALERPATLPIAQLTVEPLGDPWPEEAFLPIAELSGPLKLIPACPAGGGDPCRPTAQIRLIAQQPATTRLIAE